MKKISDLLLILMLLLQISCGALGFIGKEPPKVTVDSIKPQNISFEGLDLLLTLKISNKTPGYITFKTVDIDVFIENKKLSHVTNTNEFKIEANENTNNTLIIPLKWIDIQNLIKDYQKLDYLNMHVKGKAVIYQTANIYIGFEADIRLPAIKLSFGYSKFTIEKLKINTNILRGKISAEAGALLEFFIENHSKTKITFKNISANVNLSGNSIAALNILQPDRIENNKAFYSARFNFNPASSIIGLLKGNKAQISVTGNLDIDSNEKLYQLKAVKLSFIGIVLIDKKY